MKAVLGGLFAAGVLLAIGCLWACWRRWVEGQWRAAAAELQGTYHPGGRLSTGTIEGKVGDLPVSLGKDVSFEDGPAYHHTAASVRSSNPGSITLGIRRKSVLEQFTTRSDVAPAPTGDRDFDALFFVVSNLLPVNTVIEAPLRRRMIRLDDLEVYTQDDGVMVRRSGERRTARELVEMAEIAGALARTLSQQPARARSLVERMEDEELLTEGI